MKTRNAPKFLFRFVLALAVAVPFLASIHRAAADAPVSGAIFTTNSACIGTNINIFAAKDDVYVDGGPAHPGAAGLPDGFYYVQVTEPNGTPLGTSVGSANNTPVHVTNGEFDQCYQLSAILIKTSDGSPGYDDTTNPGGEYKVWVSAVSTFDNNSTKTDNFKIRCNDCGGSPQLGTVTVIKFYDANANGINDDSQSLNGWKMRIQDDIDFIRFTPVNIQVAAPDTYTVTESSPIEANWTHSTPTIVVFPLAVDETKHVEFGNYCTVPSGGLTLGFWSNKNGQALITSADLAALRACNLVNANGTAFDPTTAAQVKTWLLNATATNMAYMLSAQLAAMKLNVRHQVDGNAFDLCSHRTINNLIAAADASLGANPVTLSGNPNRAAQEAMKNCLDALNNGAPVVPVNPCPYSFAQ